MGRRQWPLLLVLTACGVGEADRETRWVKVTPGRVRGHPDEHQFASSAMQLRADGNTPVLECPASSVRHAVLDKDSEEACKLRGGLNPKCPDLSGLIVFLNETQTKQNFTVLDDGKIDVYLKESKLGDFKLMFNCSSSNQSLYTLKQIAVGNPPSDVENLTCISANWEVLNCSWTQPFNPAQDNNYGAFLYNRTWHCNNGDDQCVATADNGYRREDPYPPLIFMTENVLGAANFSHIIDNWAAMLPNSAEDLAAEEKSPMKILVTWTSPSPLKDFPPGLFYRLDISGLNPPFSTLPIVEKYSNSSTWEVETRIPYPWLTYEIKLRLRSGRRNATTDDHWDDGWSSNAVIGNVEVKPTAPWAAPEVGIGTFRVNRSEDLTRMDLTVMWRPLPRLLHNGPDLRYVVMCSNCSEIINTTEPVATFSGLPTSSYRVTIQPENTEGKSNETSQIIISEDLPPAPALSVVVFHRTTGQYELRWDGENDYTYTIYVCVNDSYNEDCKGFLYWLNVGNASAVNVTLQDLNITQRASKPHFALSAENAARESSGMAWDRCSYPQDYDSNPKPPIIEITETDESIILNWNLSCINRTGIVEKAEASWGPTQHNCNSHISSETQIPKHDLKYNTNYTICLRLLYRSGYSDWSTKTYSMKKEPLTIWVVGLLASVSVVLLTLLAVAGRQILRNIKKTRKALTRHINMPSVLPEEGDGAGQKDLHGSCGDLEAPHIAPEEGKHSPKIQWRSTDDQNQETSLQSKEKEKQACIHGINNTEDQHVGSCSGYVLAHDPALLSNPEEKQGMGQPDNKTERTTVDMRDDKKDDRSPPFTSKGYVQCSAMTERLLSCQ